MKAKTSIRNECMFYKNERTLPDKADFLMVWASRNYDLILYEQVVPAPLSDPTVLLLWDMAW